MLQERERVPAEPALVAWTPEEIERRAAWTAPLRRRAWRRLRRSLQGARVLEVGCGPGVICRELAHLPTLSVTGLDADPSLLRVALDRGGGPTYSLGTAESLPFDDGAFDVVVCHLVLLWLRDPVHALREMARVTRRGGTVAALAEPDLGGRLDHPDAGYSGWMARMLRAAGGHPDAGRRLGEWFVKAGLRPRLDADAVLLTPREMGPTWEQEWQLTAREMGPVLGQAQVERDREADRRAMDEGWRVLVQVFLSARARVEEAPGPPTSNLPG